MILDHLKNASIYNGLDKRFHQALSFLQNTDLNDLSLGKHELDGENLFAVVAEYETKTDAPVIWESHQKYADVQYVARGRERIGYAPLDDRFEVTKPYDAEGDAALYQLKDDEQGDLISFEENMFCMLWPDDVHAPARAWGNESETVRKIVVKVLLD